MVLPRIKILSVKDLERLGLEILDAMALRVISTIVHSPRTALRDGAVTTTTIVHSQGDAIMSVYYALNESEPEDVCARES